MRAFASRIIDARNTVEGKILSVLLSVLLVASLFNVAVFTMKANATEEEFTETSTEQVADVEETTEEVLEAPEVDEEITDEAMPEEQPEPAPIMTLGLGDPMPIAEGDGDGTAEASIAVPFDKDAVYGMTLSQLQEAYPTATVKYATAISSDDGTAKFDLNADPSKPVHHFRCTNSKVTVPGDDNDIRNGKATITVGGVARGETVIVLHGTAKKNGDNYETIEIIIVQVIDAGEGALMYDANGGEGTMEPQSGKADTTADIKACDFTRNGYTFVGWKDADGNDYQPGNTYTFKKDVNLVLYAQWEENIPTNVPSTPLDIKVRYLVQWLDEDGTTLKTEEVRGPEPIVNDKGEATVVSVTEADKDRFTAENGTNYVFDANNENNVLSGKLKTIKSDEDIVTLKLYFTEDVLGGDEPGKGDGIPDKYQTTIAFRAINGTVDGVERVEKVVTLMKDGKPAADGTYTVTESDVPTISPAEGYMPNGTWRVSPFNSVVDATENTPHEFVIEFTNYASFKIVYHFEGTDDVMENPKIGMVGDKISRHFYAPDTYEFKGNLYALDRNRVEDFDKVVTTNEDENVVNVYYAIDKIGTDPQNPDKGDGVPDKYQVTFTYSTADKQMGDVIGTLKEVVTRYDDMGNWSEDAPVNPKAIGTMAIANDGYMLVDWAEGRNSIASIEVIRLAPFDKDTDFVARFHERIDLSYTVNYIDEATGGFVAQPKVVDKMKFGEEITETAIKISGYTCVSDSQEVSLTIKTDSKNNVITFYYAKDELTDPTKDDPNGEEPGDGIPDKYQVVVTYAAVNGEVDIEKTVVTLLKDGNPAADGTGYLTSEQIATATPKEHYDQSNGSWNNGGKPTTETAITKNVDYVVTFTVNQYPYTINLIDRGTGAILRTYSGVYDYGTLLTYDAPPAIDGYNLVSASRQALAIGDGVNEMNFYYAAVPAPVVPAPVVPVVPGPGVPAAGPVPPAGVAAPAPAPAPAEEITDDATPMAQNPEGEEEGEEEEIIDDENPLGAFDVKHCWTHWMMLMGMLLTAAYGIAVARRRSSFTKDIDDFEKSVTGEKAKQRGTVTVRTGSHQAI